MSVFTFGEFSIGNVEARIEPQPLGGARVGAARVTTVLVRLLVLEPSAEGPPTTSETATVELARLPAAYEWIAYAGTEYRIVVVRHIVAGDVAAEVQLERLPEVVRGENAEASIPPTSAAAGTSEQRAMVAQRVRLGGLP